MNSDNDYSTINIITPNKIETKLELTNRKRKLLYVPNEVEIIVIDDSPEVEIIVIDDSPEVEIIVIDDSSDSVPNNVHWITTKHKHTHKNKTTDIKSNKKQKIQPLKKSPVYVFDIVYEESTAKMCIDQYNDDFELPNIDCIYENLKATLIRIVDQKLWSNQDKNIDSKKLSSSFIKGWNKIFKLGDIVKISYHPYSQKYIEYYEDQSFIGKIIFIDSDKDNAFFLVDNDDTNINNVFTIKSLERERCHFMGMSRGYDYNIESVD